MKCDRRFTEEQIKYYYKGLIDCLDQLQEQEVSQVVRKYIDLRDDVYKEQDRAYEQARVDNIPA